MSPTEIEELKIELEREKLRNEFRLREKEIAIKERDQIDRQEELRLKFHEHRRSRLVNPLVLAVSAAAIAAAGNAGVAWLNGRQAHSADLTKAEAERILEVIKTNDPDRAATNLRFLLEAGFIQNSETKGPLETYLNTRKKGEGATLPATTSSVSPQQQTVAITASPHVQDGGQATSVASSTNARLIFLNLTNEPLQLYWIDFGGTAVLYASIPPGGSLFQETYVGHLWLAKTHDGKELLRYVAKGPPPAGPSSQPQTSSK